MKIWRMRAWNRFEDRVETEYYAKKKNAETRANEINKKYANAKAQGNGGHWGNVVYQGAEVDYIETND